VEKEEDRVAVDLKQVVDDVTFTKRRTSFVDAPGNRLLGGLSWMLKRAMTTEGGRRLKRADGQWSVKAVRRYLRQVDRFLEMLLCSVHVTSGQPGRGSEITTIRTATAYCKPKIVPRFLPPQLRPDGVESTR
jgi:hypothetical protein